MTERPISVSITTRHRPAAVARCVQSLAAIAALVDRAMVFDDASHPALDVEAIQRVAEAVGVTLEVVRSEQCRGTSAARNHIARVARSPYLLSLDDDAFLLGEEAVRAALSVMTTDPGVAAVAFAQADGAGRRLPDAQQPAAATTPCYVPAFIGFASLISRERLIEIGGFREAFHMHGEEREVCLRWLDRGLHVVYLPEAVVAHAADPSNRDARTYVRQVMRNDCLAAIYNQPLARAAGIVPYKLWSFTRMRAAVPGGDPGGLRWLLSAVAHGAPAALRDRQPVKWATLREWDRLRDSRPPYSGAPP